jgi:hypothetical protein
MKLERQLYGINDLENFSASILYTDHLPPLGPLHFTPLERHRDSETMMPRPIGSSSGLSTGSYGNLFETLKLANLFPKDPEVKKVEIQLRYDFAERKDEKPHLNIGLTQKDKKGYTPFYGAHKINLFSEDKDNED